MKFAFFDSEEDATRSVEELNEALNIPADDCGTPGNLIHSYGTPQNIDGRWGFPVASEGRLKADHLVDTEEREDPVPEGGPGVEYGEPEDEVGDQP